MLRLRASDLGIGVHLCKISKEIEGFSSEVREKSASLLVPFDAQGRGINSV